MAHRGTQALASLSVLVLLPALTGCTASGTWWHSHGPRMHFTASQGCPPKSTQEDVSNPGQPTSPLLSTSPMPTSTLVCIYGYWYPDHTLPTSDDANKLIHSVRLDAQKTSTLAHTITALSLAEPHGVTDCPADMIGVRALLAFAYPDGTTTDLNYHDTGCQTLDNGTIAASQIASTSFGAFQTTLDQDIP